MEKWTVFALEQFFRHETQYEDDICLKMAKLLVKNNLVGLLSNTKPEDYKKFIE